MKKIIISCFLILCSVFVYGQSINPDSPSAIDTVRQYVRNYEYQRALSYIDKQKPNRELLLEKATCYRALNNYNQSCRELMALVREYPEDRHILTELATGYQLLNNWKGAEACYDNLIKLDSTNAYFKIKKADMLYNQDRYTIAADLYRSVYLNDGMVGVLKQLGKSFESMNMRDSAQLYYAKAWEHDFTDSQAAASYVNVTLKMGQPSVAIAACETYIAKDSTNKQINALHALSYYIMDEYESAVELFEKCVVSGDSSLIVNRSLGMCYYLLKDSAAYEFLNRAYVQDTTNNNVLYCLGVVCNDLLKSKEAIKHLTTLLDRIIPKDGALYLNYRQLAIAYRDDEQYKDAIETYAKTMQYATETQQALLQHAIAEIYDIKLRDRVNALKYYKIYSKSLTDYLVQLKAKEDPDEADILDAERRLKGLNNYIESLK